MFKSFALLNSDGAVFAYGLEGFGNEISDLLIGVGSDGGDLFK